MSEHNPQEPQARPEDDDLTVEELEHVAGGNTSIGIKPDDPNGNCAECNTNCPC